MAEESLVVARLRSLTSRSDGKQFHFLRAAPLDILDSLGDVAAVADLDGADFRADEVHERSLRRWTGGHCLLRGLGGLSGAIEASLPLRFELGRTVRAVKIVGWRASFPKAPPNLTVPVYERRCVMVTDSHARIVPDLFWLAKQPLAALHPLHSRPSQGLLCRRAGVALDLLECLVARDRCNLVRCAS